MVLAIDIGNTNIVFGCFDGDEILFREHASTNSLATDLEYASVIGTAFEIHGIAKERITGSIISSVVPSVTSTVMRAVEKLTGIESVVVGPGIKTGLNIVIDNPAQLGSDLVVAAVASIKEYPLPQIIVDLGTATTFSVVDKNKNFLGGIIMTGMAVSADALTSRTSQLPKVAFETPKRVIGTNTIDSMKSGIMYGTAGSIDGMIDRIEEELGQKCSIIATGGLSGVIASLCRHDITLDEDLLLKGLMLIYNKNK